MKMRNSTPPTPAHHQLRKIDINWAKVRCSHNRVAAMLEAATPSRRLLAPLTGYSYANLASSLLASRRLAFFFLTHSLVEAPSLLPKFGRRATCPRPGRKTAMRLLCKGWDLVEGRPGSRAGPWSRLGTCPPGDSNRPASRPPAISHRGFQLKPSQVTHRIFGILK